MNRKGDYSLRDYLIAFMFFGAVITLFSMMVISGNSVYSDNNIVDEDFESKYSRFNNYTERIESAKDSLSTEGGINVIDIGFGIFQASFAFIGLILSSIGLMSSPLDSFTQDFAIPFQVAGIIFTLFSAVIVITVVIRIINSRLNRI